MVNDTFAIRVEMGDGSTRSVPLDLDFDDVTAGEWAIVSALAKDGQLDVLNGVDEDRGLAVCLMFIKLRRDVPEAQFAGFADFALKLLDADESVVEVA